MIKNAYRHVTSTFPSEAQALCAAIELAEKDGIAVMNRKFLSGQIAVRCDAKGWEHVKEFENNVRRLRS